MGVRFAMTFLKPDGRTDWFEVNRFWLDKSQDSTEAGGDEFELGVLMDRISQKKWMTFSKNSDLTTITLLEAYYGNKMFPWMELSFKHNKDKTTILKKSILFSNVVIDSIKPRVRLPYLSLTGQLPDIDIISIIADTTALRSQAPDVIIIEPRRWWEDR